VYFDGAGEVTRDAELGLKYFRLAAVAGHVEAQLRLAMALIRGQHGTEIQSMTHRSQ
jgi:TPR repeat protein